MKGSGDMGYLRVQTMHKIVREASRVSSGFVKKPHSLPYERQRKEIEAALKLLDSQNADSSVVRALESVLELICDVHNNDFEVCAEERGSEILRSLKRVGVVNIVHNGTAN